MPARQTLVLSSLFAALALGGCSSGLGNNLPTRAPTTTGTNANLPLGIDLGVTPTSAAVEPAVAGVVVPAIGSQAARDVVLLAFASAAVANDADGAGNALSRDTVDSHPTTTRRRLGGAFERLFFPHYSQCVHHRSQSSSSSSASSPR